MPDNVIINEDDEVQKLIKKLETHYNKRVIAIVYNPEIKEGIKEGDDELFEFCKENILNKNNIQNCIVILSGFGGDLKTALICSSILRNNLKYYCCFVPSCVGSSLLYFVLQSNKLIVSKNSILTQIDPIIEYNKKPLRAIKNLSSLNNEIRRKSHEAFNYNLEILRKVLKKKKILDKKCFSKRNNISTKKLNQIIDLFMGKEYHESGLTIGELIKLKINLIIENEDQIKTANTIISKCREELSSMKEEGHNRFVIQYSGGGYYFP